MDFLRFLNGNRERKKESKKKEIYYMGKEHYLENTLPQEMIEKIIRMYKENVSIRKISEQTHVSRAALSRMLERLSIKTTYGNHYKYNTLNENFFNKIDSDKKAYWLGFLYADGCIITPQHGEQEVKLALA
jgi:agmatine/peptidylarginine deiminase